MDELHSFDEFNALLDSGLQKINLILDLAEQHQLLMHAAGGLQGQCVTVNSDDPAYFGGYMTENYLTVQKALNLDLEDIHSLAKNAIQATFLGQVEKQRLLDEPDNYFEQRELKRLPI